MLFALLQVSVDWPTWHLSIALFLFPLFGSLYTTASAHSFCFTWLSGLTCYILYIAWWYSCTMFHSVIPLHFLHDTNFLTYFPPQNFFPTSFSPHIWLSAFRTCCPSGLLRAVFNLTVPYTITFSVLHCVTLCCMLKTETASSSEILVPFQNTWGTRWRSWLRHCATNQKAAGLIHDGVIVIFHWHNPSSCTMALGFTQPLIEMITRNISWGVKAAGA